MANKLSDGVMEATDTIAKFRHLVYSVPELGKIALF